jgi:hypothetical protein
MGYRPEVHINAYRKQVSEKSDYCLNGLQGR